MVAAAEEFLRSRHTKNVAVFDGGDGERVVPSYAVSFG